LLFFHTHLFYRTFGFKNHKKMYHAGEKEVQQLAGETAGAQSNGRIIKNEIIRGAVNFIEKQNTAYVTSVDAQGQVWVSLLVGDFGFAKVPHPQEVSFDKSLIYSSKEDIFYQNIAQNPKVGSLFIELGSRRRFRVNGRVHATDTQMTLAIDEAYPNCPKYIQRRIASVPESFDNTSPRIAQGNTLTPAHSQWIAQADTFFVGSSSANAQLDASHRGGKSGFVELVDDHTLKIPDYAGNSMFNTLGNFAQNPQAGLLFVDFDKGATLQLTGKATLLFDQHSAEDQEKTGGTGRFWLFEAKAWIETQHHHQVNWELLDYSPFNP
jgi:predicted pyridoxine 5'-phosphate oxidase superfamily flavin-nucleotide-binding protein